MIRLRETEKSWVGEMIDMRNKTAAKRDALKEHSENVQQEDITGRLVTSRGALKEHSESVQEDYRQAGNIKRCIERSLHEQTVKT